MELPVAQAAGALTDRDELAGAVLRGPVEAGGLLTVAVVEPLPVAEDDDLIRFREVSFVVPRARALLGGLTTGDRVDVLVSSEEATTVLVQHAVGARRLQRAGQALLAGDEVVITLALGDGDEALAVAHGAATGELTVLRSTRATDDLPSRFPAARPVATATTVAVGA